MARHADTLTDSIALLRRRAEANRWPNVEFLLGLAEIAAMREETRPGVQTSRGKGRWWLPKRRLGRR